MKKSEKETLDAYLRAQAEVAKAEAILKANREQVVGLLKASGNVYQNKDIGFLTLSEVETRYFDNAFLGKLPANRLAEVVTVSVTKAEKVIDLTGCVYTKPIQKISFRAAV